MTLERAADLVQIIDQNSKAGNDLFTHFVDYFGLEGEAIRQFAIMCGYRVASYVHIIR